MRSIRSDIGALRKDQKCESVLVVVVRGAEIYSVYVYICMTGVVVSKLSMADPRSLRRRRSPVAL
jgi:hypothetical protein